MAFINLMGAYNNLTWGPTYFQWMAEGSFYYSLIDKIFFLLLLYSLNVSMFIINQKKQYFCKGTTTMGEQKFPTNMSSKHTKQLR